jgi:protein involved in polysaccharide export with SLBB domain
VEQFYFNQVTVLGSVRASGKYPLEPGDTVLEAIFKAGGLTFGGGTNGLPPAPILKIYRDKLGQQERLTLTADQILEQLEQDGEIEAREEIVLPLERFIMGGNLSYNIPLQPNDIVYVPPAGTVVVHGDARNPRVVFLGPGLRTLAQAITETGGLRYRADSDVEIVRTNVDGSTESFFVDARKVMRRDIRDFTLKDNDQVFIYTHPIRRILGIIGEAFSATATTGVNATYSPTAGR